MTGEVSPLQRGDGAGAAGVPAAAMRASHEDRDRAVELLRVAAGDGRLTAEELDERLEVALTARTYGELAAVVADLPAAPDAALEAPAAAKDVVHIECRSSSTKRDGRWVVPRRMEIQVTSGHVRLDFTEAVITQPLLHIDAEVHSGTLRLITRPGVLVDTDDVTLRSSQVRIREPWGRGAPAQLRIQVSGEVSSGIIAASPPRLRRTFWEWLRRRPHRYALPAAPPP